MFFLSEIQVRRKQEVVIGNLGPGDSFGEKSFIKSAPLEQSVVAEKKLIIASIGVEDIEGKFQNIFVNKRRRKY